MTQIWHNAGSGWTRLSPSPYAREQELHDLVIEAPELLPLAGSPQVIVLGREVRLGAGRVDVLGVEAGGRPVLMEIKLQASAEARRAVVAQVLAYAAFLHGSSLEDLQSQLTTAIGSWDAGTSIADVVRSQVQTVSIETTEFERELRAALASGAFRLVLILDQAPDELVRLVGYLQRVAPALVVDLVTLAAYEVGSARVLVPQRVEPEPVLEPQVDARTVAAATTGSRVGTTVAGSDAFRDAARGGPHESDLMRLAAWAEGLAEKGHAILWTYFGKRGEVNLLPWVPGLSAGLVTLWNWKGDPLVSVWRSAFLREAPESVIGVEEALDGETLGQGTSVTPSETFLAAVRDAYAEAHRRRTAGQSALGAEKPVDTALRD